MKENELSLNEKIKRFTNNHLPKTRFLQIEYNGEIYEIKYHKAGFWWQERFSIKEYIKNLYTNHWEANECIGGSRIFILGKGSGIIYGFFPRRKMKKQLDVILSDYKRVLKENKELKDDIENISDENEVLKEECIPIQKVKDKIAEIRNNKENYIFERLTSEDIKKTIITNLQELLEK